MEITFALIFALFVSNAVWFIYYKQAIQKQADIYKEYSDYLKKHEGYLKEQEQHAVEMTLKLNDTVKLVTENMKYHRS